ncbi:GntR family transcriptional regulator [Chitinilyticum piscinae]|uniref:GntR family transcriptional regulator n=1 Tax=Chitinilyticum piscinae TaxID=2866724 RepID=A0A8J7K204_9NEIS|nr:GntR family transcriptional regulator [Chitinilyticum piscinae]MBE9609926.1 GntR family transcriptional regulator [Chitinilyticum piscinae]
MPAMHAGLDDERLLVLRPDPDSPVPLYLQLSERIAAAIQAGFWHGDEPLPSERALTDLLDVSRVTARKALDLLCERGLISRRHGSGTYVTSQLEVDLGGYVPLTERLAARGLELRFGQQLAEVDIAEQDEMLQLQLAVNARVLRVMRTGGVDDEVYCVERLALPAVAAPDPLPENLQEWLQGYRRSVVRVIQKITACSPTSALLDVLCKGQEQALLRIEQQEFAHDGRILLFSTVWVKGGDYTLLTELQC